MLADGSDVNNWEFFRRHFGDPRLQHCLSVCTGDEQKAAELYRWNVAISAAFWESFAYFEVALRNAIDERLSLRHLRLGRAGHWIFDDARELGRDGKGPRVHLQPYTDIDEAIRRVRRNQQRVDSGQIISELSFGFWHQMVSRKQTSLWPDIASAFPHAPDRTQSTVHDPVRRLRQFRNRISHHHRI
jgi:hypothetical protein